MEDNKENSAKGKLTAAEWIRRFQKPEDDTDKN